MNKRILSFDVESNGLHGECFAVAALINDLDLYQGARDMRDAFWVWFNQHRENVQVWADFGWPVEARFFSQCIQDDITNREWKGPYPLFDLGTLLLASDLDPDLDRFEFCNEHRKRGYKIPEVLHKHNPFDDAITAGYTALYCLERAKDDRETMEQWRRTMTAI
jgi:hypothetical protein